MSTKPPVRLSEKLNQFESRWTPHRIARFDGHQVLLAKLEGEFVWHDHADHDEVFHVLSGTLWIDLENEPPLKLEAGDLAVVPAGTRHRPRTEPGREVQVLLIDPMEVKHTGNVESELTVTDIPEL